MIVENMLCTERSQIRILKHSVIYYQSSCWKKYEELSDNKMLLSGKYLYWVYFLKCLLLTCLLLYWNWIWWDTQYKCVGWYQRKNEMILVLRQSGQTFKGREISNSKVIFLPGDDSCTIKSTKFVHLLLTIKVFPFSKMSQLSNHSY